MPRPAGRKPSARAKDVARKTKKKVCYFCTERVVWVDYKDVNILRRYMSDRGKIRARRVTGNCAQHQRDVAVAIKTARELALLPYTQRTVTERGRGPRGGGPPPSMVEEAVAEVDLDEVVDVESLEFADVDDDVADGTSLSAETDLEDGGLIDEEAETPA